MIGERYKNNVPSIEDLSWAVFLYNASGEDEIYLDTMILLEGKNSIDIGEELVNFLNRWRTRVPREPRDLPRTSISINKWYSEFSGNLFIDSDIMIEDVDLKDPSLVEKIMDAYNGLSKIPFIGPTSRGKILHMLNPHLFVAWDKAIIENYLPDAGENARAEDYILFLRIMQNMANEVLSIDKNIVESLSEGVIRLNELNLTLINKAKEKQERLVRLNFLQEKGKTMAKFLDEYNWIMYTRKISLPPPWNPCNRADSVLFNDSHKTKKR